MTATYRDTDIKAPAPPGAEKPFRDALLRALARCGGDDPAKGLDMIADKTVEMALAGDGEAIKELAARRGFCRSAV